VQIIAHIVPERLPMLSRTLTCLAAALLAIPAAARAETRQMAQPGTSLAVASPCARAVTIMPDPTLSGRVVLDATADHPEEIAQLRFDAEGKTAKLRGPRERCWTPEGDDHFETTLRLALHVPAGMPVTIDESGGADYTLGAIGGSLTLNVSGGIKLRAAHVRTMTMDISGGADLTIEQLEGSLHAELSGGSKIRIDQATLSDMTLSMSGGGGLQLGGGSIGRFNLELSGAGAVGIGATVGDATISLSGVGDVKIAKVTGRLTKDVEGVGNVTVGEP
jgi:hypothetical protein